MADMATSGLRIAGQYEVCEAEDLVTTGQIQAGVDLLAVSHDGRRVHSNLPPDLMSVAFVDRVSKAPAVRQVNASHDLVEPDGDGPWIRHDHADFTICERARHPTQRGFDFDPIGWTELREKCCDNLWKYNFLLCAALHRALRCDRAMIYRFHPDWSGEIIAEQVGGDLEPFLGLHYPPTDIPAQARALFLKVPARQIFGVSGRTNALLGYARGHDDALQLDGASAPLDTSLCLSRAVSPYHLEYLRNMGSGGTAACAIRVDGRLWGLVSLHFQKDRRADIEEFMLLSEVAQNASAAIADLVALERRALEARAERMVERLKATLGDQSDPFHALILSDNAPQKMVGGDGVCLMVGSEICASGLVPDQAVLRAIAARADGDAPLYLSELPASIPKAGRNRIAGCAVFRLSKSPRCHFMVFRRELSQVVIWGGDPRRLDLGDTGGRVSPRQSFEKWVETVEGRALEWTDLDRVTLERAIGALSTWFGVTGRELALLIRNGLRQCMRRRDDLHERAVGSINTVGSAMALGRENAPEPGPSVIALNQAASEVFGISAVEARMMTIDRFENVLGLSMRALAGGVPHSVTIPTPDRGLREYEVSANLMFEYVNEDGPAAFFRLTIHDFKDVTETRRVEQALKAARDRALRQADLRSEFFAKLSHELRTPLNAIVGISSLLVERAERLEPRLRKRLESLFRASGHMADVIEMSLRNAECVHTLDTGTIGDLALRDMVDEVFGMLGLQAQQQKVALRNLVPEDLVIPTEPRAMRQLLLNLICNAIKYNVPNGTVTIAMARTGVGFVTLTITDTGIGMTGEQVENCMRPYTRYSEGQGSGLGLSISSHLVAAMGGYLTLSSEQGIGTVVSLRLPLEVVRTQSSDPKLLAEAGTRNVIGA